MDKMRKDVREKLENIVKNLKEIDGILSGVKHNRGMVQRSLNPKKQEYIVHFKNGGITAEYRDSQGNKYEIHIHKR